MGGTRCGAIGLAMLLACFLAGCERTRIADILKDPARYAGEQVTIVGKVTSTGPQMPTPGAFELDDGTGRLWVLSTNYVYPALGARIAVTGFVEGGVRLGTNVLPTAMQEIKRMAASGD